MAAQGAGDGAEDHAGRGAGPLADAAVVLVDAPRPDSSPAAQAPTVYCVAAASTPAFVKTQRVAVLRKSFSSQAKATWGRRT